MQMSVDDVIASAEELVNSTDASYTKESMDALTSALDQLKAIKSSYTTAEDPMVSDITTNYGTAADRVKGYGSVANSADKDGKLNRFKKGISTLLDKTIYTQAAEGQQEQSADYTSDKAPVVKGVDEAKSAVINAMNGLETVKDGLANEKDADGNLYYYKDGKAATDVTGVYNNQTDWYYVKDGKVDFNYTGIKNNQNGWWRIENGKVNFNYTGVTNNENGWWYVKNGQVDFRYNGIRNNQNGWWKIVNGKVDFGYTGVSNNENGWWRIENGKVNFGYNGIADNANGTWVIKNGKVDFSYSGKIKANGKTYHVTNGKVKL